MPYTAAKRLRWGDSFIEIGEAVPDNEPGRRYDLMVRYGEITGAPAAPVAETAVALVIQQEPAPPEKQNGGTSSLPAIDLATATKRDLMAWIATVTGKEPGPASKEDTLRTRVAELLAERSASNTGQDGGGDLSQPTGQVGLPEQQPAQRLSEGLTSGTMTAPTEPALRTT